MPATKRVVHIEPGPIPTFIMSTPSLIKKFAASGVAIFPAQIAVFLSFFFYFFNYFSNFFGMTMSGINNN